MGATVISARVNDSVLDKLNNVSSRTRLSRTLIVNVALEHFFSLSDDERGKILLQYLSRSDE